MTNKKTSQSETKEVSKTQKSQSTANDNKIVFGPLKKYAIIAVIMVSVIVTTAIMLNKELGTVEQQVAEMLDQVATKNDADESAELSTDAAKPVTVETVTSEVLVTEAPVTAIAAEKQAANQKQELTSVEIAVENQAAEKSQEEVVATQVSAATASTTQTSEDLQAAIETQEPQLMPYQQAMQVRARENQARIETHKLEQKQRMAEMFAHVKTLESKNLSWYKESQDKQIARLREQITQQQEMIEALILRNKEQLELRQTNLERSQTRREEILNRI